ncbi:hypothetical protein GP486_002802 [Trichoglossum hirsutum]|uniref:Uncharacterized protein n=1 Tax=Trichoglossum hirsutum TaxID=265104 RepID=A0A9P8LDN6_9PEZI|nr:hypothetical protein GP486_002802 [Trichoglossum hirsutum]
MTKRCMLGTNSIHSAYSLGPQLYDNISAIDTLASLSSYQAQDNYPGPTAQETVAAQSCAPVASNEHILEAQAAPLEFHSYEATASGSFTLSPRAATGVSRHSDEVCYGMVCDVKAQFLDDSRNLDEVDLEITAVQPANGFYNLQLIFRRHCFLQSRNGKDIAIVHFKTSNALRALNDLDSVRYEVYVAPNEWAEKILSFKNIGKAACITVELNIFGSVDKSHAVGKVLSKAGIYLQHPRLLDSHIEYENPHFISFSHLSLSNSRLPTPSLTPDSGSSPSSTDISSVLDNLDQRGYLRKADIDAQITSTLLR